MLLQPTLEKLESMRLHGMAQALREQNKDEQAHELIFEDRLALLVDRQMTWRQNEALQARLRRAKLRGNACVEDVDFRTARGLDKSLFRSLTQESAWVARHENVFVCGPTGVGKSYLAAALAHKACRDGYSVHYTRATALFRDLALAAPMAACATYSNVGVRSISWSSTIGLWLPSPKPNGVIFGRSARIATKRVPSS